ncbi:hypothetical protein CPSG_08123 [Coccidioides posadasii str. Silveira]|uniref:Uncharacterized protein n=1 Tax=Coccidioides posadasii (strain RMSCC 757 / Silveira) TaxID=443226 RepID=E9DDG1_COCPS|nr:hypothetical protein CPSG_08123 [Coccidioides posadasii str. Silveira]
MQVVIHRISCAALESSLSESIDVPRPTPATFPGIGDQKKKQPQPSEITFEEWTICLAKLCIIHNLRLSLVECLGLRPVGRTEDAQLETPLSISAFEVVPPEPGVFFPSFEKSKRISQPRHQQLLVPNRKNALMQSFLALGVIDSSWMDFSSSPYVPVSFSKLLFLLSIASV